VDVAVVNGELSGYEIKSDEDTLARLEGQVDAYGRVLDRAYLVTTSRHFDRALDHVPGWWGVLVARQDGPDVTLTEIRPGIMNSDHDPYSIAQLLWRDEALDELRLNGKGSGLSRAARHYVWSALAESVTIDQLRVIVRRRLKERQAWPGGQ
jgi:hypothetical protein